MNDAVILAVMNLLVATLRPEGVDEETLKEYFDPQASASKALAELLQTESYVALGQNTWGRGPTQEIALHQMVKHGGDRKRYVIYRVPPGTSVSEMGGFQYPNAAVMLGFEEPQVVAQKGVKVEEVQPEGAVN